MPTNSTGAGFERASVSATADPRPPYTLCSSATTARPVFPTDARTVSSSRGFTLNASMTSTSTPSAASIWAAFSACSTSTPQATMVASEPSRST